MLRRASKHAWAELVINPQASPIMGSYSILKSNPQSEIPKPIYRTPVKDKLYSQISWDGNSSEKD